ncbi:MAG: peptide-binding protein [Desulfuromonadales bacterium]
MTALRLILFVLILCLYGCPSDKEGASDSKDGNYSPPSGDTIIMGSIGEPSNLIPALSSDSSSSDINGLVYEGLLRYDKNYNLEPVLAESWDISEDNLTITFHLREGVEWHDGEPFTSADVLFTYEMMIDPETPTAYAEDFMQVAEAEAPDPYTFRVRYDEPFAPGLVTWGFPVHPEHLLEGEDITDSSLSRSPVGTGPYRFVKWSAGREIVLEANHDYFEGPPNIHRVLYRIIPDQTTMFLELQSGSLDYMSLTPMQYARRTDTPAFKRRYQKFRYPASSYTYLGYNLRHPLFEDRRVRQAISYAINEEEIIQGVLHGLGQPANGPYKPGTWAHNPNVEDYPYNPDKAREILAEAGWSDTDNDGILDRDGRPFSFTIITNQGNEQRIKTGEIIQRRLMEIGMEVELRVIEWATFLKEFVNPGKFDAIILGWTIPPDPDSYDVWHSSKTDPRELNFIGFKNEEVDDLLEKGRRTLDQEKRRQFYWRFQEILAKEQPYTFLYVPDALPAVSARFQGIEPAPAGIMYNFTEWYVPEKEQKYTR